MTTEEKIKKIRDDMNAELEAMKVAIIEENKKHQEELQVK